MHSSIHRDRAVTVDSLGEQIAELDRRLAVFDDPTRPAATSESLLIDGGISTSRGSVSEMAREDDDPAFYRSERDAWQKEAGRLAKERDELREKHYRLDVFRDEVALAVGVYSGNETFEPGVDGEILEGCREAYQALMDAADTSHELHVAQKERDELLGELHRLGATPYRFLSQELAAVCKKHPRTGFETREEPQEPES